MSGKEIRHFAFLFPCLLLLLLLLLPAQGCSFPSPDRQTSTESMPKLLTWISAFVPCSSLAVNVIQWLFGHVSSLLCLVVYLRKHTGFKALQTCYLYTICKVMIDFQCRDYRHMRQSIKVTLADDLYTKAFSLAAHNLALRVALARLQNLMLHRNRFQIGHRFSRCQ